MSNPFRRPYTGTARQYMIPPVPSVPRIPPPPPDPNAYYGMSGPYHQASGALPYGTQPPQAHQSCPPSAFVDDSDPFLRQTDQQHPYPPYEDSRQSALHESGDQQISYPQDAVTDPTDSFFDLGNPQESYPQYAGNSPRALSQPFDQNQPYPQQAASVPPRPFQNPVDPIAPAPAPGPGLGPRIIPAVQLDPAHYLPLGGLGEPLAIQAEQQEDPFAMAAQPIPHGGGGRERQGQGHGQGVEPQHPSFLKSNIKPHDDSCPFRSERTGDDSDEYDEEEEDDEEDDEEDEKMGGNDRFCRRKASKSPTVLKRDRGNKALTRRVAQLEAKLAKLEGSHQREMADLKRRAVEAIADAASQVGGIQRGSELWDRMIQDAQKKMNRTPELKDED